MSPRKFISGVFGAVVVTTTVYALAAPAGQCKVGGNATISKDGATSGAGGLSFSAGAGGTIIVTAGASDGGATVTVDAEESASDDLDVQRARSRAAFKRASDDFTKAAITADQATEAKDKAAENVTTDGGVDRLRVAAAALSEAEAKRESARAKMDCLEKDRDAVEQRTTYGKAWGLYGGGALGAGDQYRAGGVVFFSVRPGVATEIEVGASASEIRALAPRDSRSLLLGAPVRIYFGRVAPSGVSTALYLGTSIEFVNRAVPDEDARRWYPSISGQLGLRFQSTWPRKAWPSLRVFAEPRMMAGIDGVAPVTVLFGAELGFGVPIGEPREVPRWVWTDMPHGATEASKPGEK